MISTRVRTAMACGAVALLVGACGGGDGQASKAPTSSPAGAATPSTVTADAGATTPRATDTAAATAPQTPAVAGATASAPPTASVADVQALIASMTAQLSQAAAAGPGTPAPTSEEIKAQLLEQLRQLGVTL